MTGQRSITEQLQGRLSSSLAQCRDSARAIELIGCDRRCRPARAGWLRTREARHTEGCIARRRVVGAIRSYANLFGRGTAAMERHLNAALHAELERYLATIE